MAPKKAAPKAAKKAPAKSAPAKAAPAKKAKVALSENPSAIHVKGLNFPGMNHETVEELFSSYGKVAEVRLRKAPVGVGNTLKDHSFVIVFFNDAASAKKALAANGKTINNCKVKVTQAKSQPTPDRSATCTSVAILNLHGGATQKALCEWAKAAGKIVRSRIYDPKHLGFIYYADNAAAKKAVKELNGTEFQGVKVEVTYSIRTMAADKAKFAGRQARAEAAATVNASYREIKQAKKAKKN